MEHFSEFNMTSAAILNSEKFSTFDLDDLQGNVIPLFGGFRGWGFHFWSYSLDMGVDVKVKSEAKCQI